MSGDIDFESLIRRAGEIEEEDRRAAMIPRSTSGARFHPFGTEAYAVAVDTTGDEVSERHSGQLWIAISNLVVDLLFVDDAGGNQSTFTLTRAASGIRLSYYVDGDMVGSIDSYRSLGKGSTINVDWTSMYGAMA